METSDNETTVYVIINGAFLTGKSGLASYLIGKPQKPKHGTISSDWIPVDYNFHGQQIRVFILDTNGFEIKNTLRSLMQNQCKAIILTYDVCNITSFKELDTRFQIYSHDISKGGSKF